MTTRLLLLFVLAAVLPSTGVAQQITVVRGATVLAMTGAAPLADADVAIQGGRIIHVGPRGSFRAPGARIVDARGRWLVPGFIDMHAHVTLGPVLGAETGAPRMVPDTSVPRRSLRTLLAFGVTTIRDPGAGAGVAVAVRDSVARGQLVGPRIFTAGEVIDRTVFPGLTAPVQNEAEVRAEVRRQAAAGVDYIKLYATLPPALLCAGVAEAHAQGRKAVAHLFATSWTVAARCGIDGILHAMPSSPALLPADRRSAFLRGVHNTRFMFQWFEYADLASPEIDSMVQAMVDGRVVHDPTLVIFEALAWGDSARITASPDLALAAPSLLENWRNAFTLSAGWRPAEFDSARAVWSAVQRFVRFLHQRGVRLVAGTDANNPWVVPGPSFHRELELLVAAGIPPGDVLRIATHNGADALGILADVGTIEPGKRADLVLLGASPLADIRNTRRIEWVMQGGRMLQAADLLPR